MKKLAWLLFPVTLLLLLAACNNSPAAGCTHTYGDWAEQTPATCTALGCETRVCSTCGAIETRPIEALPHEYGLWSEQTPATCTEAGLEKRSCSICEAFETRPTEALPHEYGAWAVTSPATCTKEGSEKRVCAVCQAPETRPTAMLSHTFGAWGVKTPATCVAEGVEERTCLLCEVPETRPIDKIPHVCGEWSIAVAPTCINEGSEKRVCTTRGCDYYEERLIDKLSPHPWGEWVTVTPASCTTKGTEKRVCTTTDCEAFETRDIDILPHEYEWIIDVEATEEHAGKKHEKCKNCLATRNENTEIPAIVHVHSMTFYAAVSASCQDSADGTLAYYHCSKCNKNYTTEAGLTADELSSIVDTKRTHNMTPVAKLDATCIAVGNIAYFHCNDCDKAYIDEAGTGAPLTGEDLIIPMCAHNYGEDFTVDAAATPEKHGSKSRHCTQNGCTAKTDVTDLHYVTAVAAKDSTCYEEGNIAHFHCAICGWNFKDVDATEKLENITVIKKDHVFADVFTVDTAASATAHGLKSRHCTEDGCTATEDPTEIHYLVYVEKEDSTCFAKGHIAHHHCEVCGDNYRDADATILISDISIAEKLHDYDTAFTIDKAATEAEEGLKSRHCKTPGCTARVQETVIPKLDPSKEEWTPSIK